MKKAVNYDFGACNARSVCITFLHDWHDHNVTNNASSSYWAVVGCFSKSVFYDEVIMKTIFIEAGISVADGGPVIKH